MLLGVAGLARSTFFYHQAKRDQPDALADLKAAIRDAFEAAHGRYGHRRVHAVLTKQGWQVAKKTVLKLMRALGLICKVRRRRRYNSFKGEVGTIADNVLNRGRLESEVGHRRHRVPGLGSQSVSIPGDRLVRSLRGRALMVAVTEPDVDQHIAEHGDRDPATRSASTCAL